MATCPVCFKTMPDDARLCPYCGTHAEAVNQTQTVAPRTPSKAASPQPSWASSTPSDSSIDESRFAPGTVLAERYRIVAMLGKGGMGEVYRADDLKLRQSVALKFLPVALSRDPGRLERLHQEVRIARQVSHPNVCRVYDIAEANGQPFLTMEYVAGEDLVSILRKFGKPSRERALQIARQICAGLAAAHDKGVLHRDLKPANIMLDDQGRVRITDFGLAGFADQLRDDDRRVGTPAYQSPEQSQGEAITPRSDIYSLGLVLFELFTGRRALSGDTVAAISDSRRRLYQSTIVDLSDELEPGIQEGIARCLRQDPMARPPSALSVSAALPGGDPLAAALAAGETPSPEIVAGCTDACGMRQVTAIAFLALTILAVAVSIWLKDRTSLLTKVPLTRPPTVLVDRARQILTKIGHTSETADEAYWFQPDGFYLDHVKQTDKSATRWDRLKDGRPPALLFYYRASPQPLMSLQPRGLVNYNDPPFYVGGMSRMQLDTHGRLHRLTVVPPAYGWSPPQPSIPDWTPLFDEAGLLREDFMPTEPLWTPAVNSDYRAAWTGHYPDKPDEKIVVEVASFQGKPVSFLTIGGWIPPPGTTTPKIDNSGRIQSFIFISLFVIVMSTSIFLTLRHLRANRGDRRGALRLAVYVLIVYVGKHLTQAHHVPSSEEATIWFNALASALAPSLIVWFLYMALEPYARRLWPRSLVTWSRVLMGRLRDPVVGRHILLGSVIAACVVLLDSALPYVDAKLIGEIPTPSFQIGFSEILRGGRHVLGQVFQAQDQIGIFIGCGVVILLLRLLLRHDWLAVIGFVLIVLALRTAGFKGSAVSVAFQLAGICFFTFALVRWGLLAMVSAAVFMGLNLQFPATYNFSNWYSIGALVGPVLAIAWAGFGFWVALAGRPLIRDELLK